MDYGSLSGRFKGVLIYHSILRFGAQRDFERIINLIKSLLFQAEKITTILKAAKVEVEPFWPGLFAKCCESVDVKELISNVGSGVGSAPAAGGAAAAAPAGGDAAPAAEAKKEEEPEEESDDDMGFGLFD